VDVLHPSRPNVSRADLAEKLAAIYKADKARVVTFGLRTQFGGGRSTGFALIYDDEASQRKFEPRYRLVRVRERYRILLMLSQFTCVYSQEWRPRWRRLRVSYGRNARTVRRRFVSYLSTYSSVASDLLPSAPWYQKSQGCRASQEGQVDDGTHLCLLAFVVSMHTMLIPRSYAYASLPSSLCIAYRISIPKTWSTLKVLSKNDAANRVVYGYLNILRLRKEDED